MLNQYVTGKPKRNLPLHHGHPPTLSPRLFDLTLETWRVLIPSQTHAYKVEDHMESIQFKKVVVGTEDAYQKARFALQERYGNCNVVSTAFINKLESWPKIGHKDGVALREFLDFLNKILAARKTTLGLSILDYAKENVKLLAKLPYHLEIKWRDAIKQWRYTHGEA